MNTEEQIQKFQEIFEAEFGQRVSKAESIKQGTEIINLIEIIFSPCRYRD